ncbi:MAG: hypothetical protein ACI93G_002033, partial [Hyphomonas sp.]
SAMGSLSFLLFPQRYHSGPLPGAKACRNVATISRQI